MPLIELRILVLCFGGQNTPSSSYENKISRHLTLHLLNTLQKLLERKECHRI